jgi:hypothetical protein
MGVVCGIRGMSSMLTTAMAIPAAACNDAPTSHCGVRRLFSEKDAGEVSYGGQEGHEENKGNFWQRQLHVCNCHEHRQETPRQNQS